MKKAARNQVLMNGEPVVEIDYKTLHPAILYAEAGAPLPNDCYEIPGWPRELRPLIKVALLIMINAKTKSTARFAIAHHQTMTAVCVAGSQEALATADRLMSDIRRVHKPISGAFHSDAGARLMRMDSDIAEAVMLTMLAQGVLVLCVHDSFLVPVSKAGMLEEAMICAAHGCSLMSIQLARCGGG